MLKNTKVLYYYDASQDGDDVLIGDFIYRHADLLESTSLDLLLFVFSRVKQSSNSAVIIWYCFNSSIHCLKVQLEEGGCCTGVWCKMPSRGSGLTMI